MKLNERQKETVRLVCDTFFPSIEGGAPFLRRKATDFGVDLAFIKTLEELLPAGAAEDLGHALDVIESPLYNLVLSRIPRRFSKMTQNERERFLSNWRDSVLPVKRTAFQAMKRLSCFLAYTVPDGSGRNPNWEDIGYPGPMTDERVAHPEQLKISPFVPEADSTVSCDVCVVGSGSGGSVVAYELATEGFDVLVLEQGSYETSDSFQRDELTMTQKLFQQNGTAATKDLSFVLLAGRAAGGGTIVNWNTCLRPPHRILKEWESEFGIDGLTGEQFSSYVEEVWRTLRVNAGESQRNGNNQAIWDGCKALGMVEGKEFDVIQRNAVGCNQRCDYCSYGCVYACKQSTIMNYLPMAHAAGARFVFDARASNLVVDGGRATGVDAVHEGPGGPSNFRVKAKATVVACGGIETPALLLRSGIKAKGIGDYLRLDPTAAVGGAFEKTIASWRGPPQTVAVWKYIDLDGTYHGFWIECAPAHPGLFALSIPWLDGRSHKDFMKQYYSRSADSIVLLREWGHGRVTIDRYGNPVVSYRLDRRDQENMLRGIEESARILAAAGAVSVWTAHSTPVTAGNGKTRLGEQDLASLSREVRKRGLSPNRMMLYSAHLMGSCRMSSDPGTGPTRPSGELYSVDGLFVADGSVFPTTPGVNPMVTIMAMARRTAESIKSSLKGSHMPK